MGSKNALMKNSFPIFVLAAKMVDLPKIFSTNVLFKLYNIIYRRPNMAIRRTEPEAGCNRYP